MLRYLNFVFCKLRCKENSSLWILNRLIQLGVLDIEICFFMFRMCQELKILRIRFIMETKIFIYMNVPIKKKHIYLLDQKLCFNSSLTLHNGFPYLKNNFLSIHIPFCSLFWMFCNFATCDKVKFSVYGTNLNFFQWLATCKTCFLKLQWGPNVVF